MGRGFYTTFGAGATDAIETGFTTHATLRSYFVRFYLNGPGAGTGPRLWDKRTSGAQVDICYYNPAFGQIWMERSNGQWTLAAVSPGLTASLMVTLDTGSVSNTPKAWLNGVSQTIATSAAMSSITTNADSYVIGNRFNDLARPWDGTVEEFAIFDGVLLGDAEAQALHGGRSSLYYAKNLACYFSLDDAKVIRDLSPAGTKARRVIGTRAWPPQQKVVYPHRWSLAAFRGAQATGGGGTVTGAGNAAGSGVASGIGAATAAAVAQSSGAGQALGVSGLAPTTGVAAAAGLGTAAAIGAATASATATAAGLGTALAAGASIGIVAAVGNAAGIGTALGVSPSLGGGVDLAKARAARRKRIAELPPEFRDDLERWRAEEAPAVPAEQLQPRIKLNRAERKAAQILARAKSADPAVAAAAQARIDAMPTDSPLARMLERQQAMDMRRLQILAEEEDAVQAFIRWMISQ